MILYHIVEKKYWDTFSTQTHYLSPTFEEEKFIHLSTETQVAGVLERYYKDKTDLLKLHLDSEKFSAELKFEKATNNEFFPHLYGKLNKDSVIKIEVI